MRGEFGVGIKWANHIIIQNVACATYVMALNLAIADSKKKKKNLFLDHATNWWLSIHAREGPKNRFLEPSNL